MQEETQSIGSKNEKVKQKIENLTAKTRSILHSTFGEKKKMR